MTSIPDYGITRAAPSFAIWAISSDDIPDIKRILEVLLGDVSGPSHRLEIFARLAGFGSYAALGKALSDASSAPECDPIPLFEDRPTADGFLATLPLDLRQRLFQLDKLGILRLVAGGLSATRHPLFGHVGLPPDADAPFIARITTELFDLEKPDRRSRSPLITTFELLSSESIAFLSPENQQSLRTADGRAPNTAEAIGRVRQEAPSWIASIATIGRRGGDPSIDAGTAVTRVDAADLARTRQECATRTAVFYAENDRILFNDALRARGLPPLSAMRTLVLDHLLAEIETDTPDRPIWTAGHFGLVRLDSSWLDLATSTGGPARLREPSDGEMAAVLHEMHDIVLGCASELDLLAAA